jgi:ABC-type multidrug transport system fused ATPase/permease subunit
MEAVGNAIGIIIRKPFILIYWGILTLVFTLAEYLLPVFKTIYELSTISGSNFFESIISFIQVLYGFLSDTKVVIIGAVVLLAVLAAISILAGILLSGYFYKLNNAVNKKQGQKNEFITGIKEYFGPMWIVNYIVFIVGMLLLIIMVISAVPALIITRATIDKGLEMLPAVLFVDVLTCVVLFFGAMFFRIYVFFLYPALMNNGRNIFLKAKRFADRNFWKLLSAIFIFDVIFVGFQIMYISFNDNIWLLLLKWAFLTIFYALTTTYVFTAYKKYSGKREGKKA